MLRLIPIDENGELPNTSNLYAVWAKTKSPSSLGAIVD